VPDPSHSCVCQLQATLRHRLYQATQALLEPKLPIHPDVADVNAIDALKGALAASDVVDWSVLPASFENLNLADGHA
jgi:hypothetical protein